MKHTVVKRIGAWLLVLCLLVGMLPTSALAANAPEEAEPEAAALEAETRAEDTEELPSWWNDVTESCRKYFWNYNMSIVNQSGTGTASQIRNYYGKDLSGNGKPAYLNYNDMATGMGNFEWGLNFDAVNDKKFYFRWIGVKERANFKNSEIIYIPFSADFTVPAYTEYEILWEFGLKTTRNSKGTAGFYAEVFSWGEEFPAASSLKFMTGDTNQASPKALTLSNGTRVYADADGQHGTVKVRVKYSNGTAQPKTFTPKFGMLSGVGESDSLSNAYHHTLQGSTTVTATCQERPFNEPIARVDGVDYQDMGKAVEAFNLSSRESSTFELLKNYGLFGSERENPPVYTFSHSGVVEMNGKYWEVGSLVVKSGNSVQFRNGKVTIVGDASTYISNDGGNVTLDNTTVAPTYGTDSTTTGIYSTGGEVKLKNASSVAGGKYGIQALSGAVTVTDGSQVRVYASESAGSAVRATGNVAVQVSGSQLRSFSGAAVDMSGGGTLRLSGDTLLTSSKSAPQIDLGGSAKLVCDAGMNAPSEPYRLRAEFDAAAGFRAFTQNWGVLKAQGAVLDDYFVNTITSNGAESKIIPGGYFAEKDGEAVIEHNAVTLEANGGRIQGTEDDAVTLYTDMAGKLSEYPSAVWAGHSFAGWYSADERRCGSSTVFTEKNTAVHARWGEAGIPVTLDYNQEGGTTEDRRKVILGKPYNQIFGEEGDHALPGADQMVRYGYTFDGWYTQPEGGERVTDSTVVTNPEAHSIYAQWRPNEYTMTVGNLNGGTLPGDQTFEDTYTLTFGEAYPELPTPTKPGYRLASWRNQYGTRINAGDTVDKTYNQTLTALWELKLPTYNVTLDPGEGGRIANGYGLTYEVNGGEPYGKIPSALRDGYIFDGWWTQKEGGEQITSASTVPIIEDESEAGTLYAHWTRKNYTVTFYDGYKVVDTVIVPAGDKAPEPEDPVKAGYSFNGWRTQRYGQGEAWDFDDPVNGSLVLYTYWTSHMLTVTLNANGGRLPYSASDGIGYDKRTAQTYGELPTPTPPDPTQEFIGWYTEMENGSLVTAETTLTGVDHTLYAHWGPRHYALTFDANGGACDTGSVKAGEENVLGVLPVPTRSGYTFDGWFTSKSGGTQIQAGDTLSADVTVYARWTRPQYTVEFNLAGGTMADTAKTVALGGAFGVLPSPTKPGYRFTSWWYEPEGGDPLYITERTTVPAMEGNTITLTAHWSSLDYTVTLDGNGGTSNPSRVTVQSGLAYGTLPTPTRTGYTFSGWYTAADGAGTKIEAGSTFDQGGNQTLYAHWTADTYTVNFIPGENGSVTPASKTVTYGGTYGELPTPTKAGETFVGWYTAQSGGRQVTVNTPVECVESKTIDLYAHWRTTHAHPVGEGGTDVDFVGVTSLSGISTDDGKAYFLEDNISVDSTISLYSTNRATVTICLNGKTITGPAGAPAFSTTGDLVLRICDCQGGGKITLAPGSGTAEGIIHENANAVHLYGGTITGNKGGCGVYVDNGFHMYGGAITDNKTTGNGGGVHVRSGAFSMYGGVISGNTADGSGGGVGKADGGSGSITISGGAITGNKAARGGGVFSDNTKMVMTGGSISGNTATDRYGGAYSERGIAMTGGEITGNKAPLYGGFGVIPSQYVGNEHYGGAALVLGGTAKIIGNTANDGAASNLFLYAETKDGSTPVEKLSVTIDSTNPPTAGAQIGITAETTPYHLFPVDISKAGSGDYSAYFISDDPSCSVQNSGADAAQVLRLVKYAPRHEHPFCGPDGCGLDAHSTHTPVTYQPLESGTIAKLATPNNLPAGNYCLTEDITLSSKLTIPENATVNLCLNGHSISAPNNTAIQVESGSTLRLCDCVGGGKIANSSRGVLNYGTFELYSGSISSNSSIGVYNTSNGIFHMYSGSISGNTTSGYGGGVYNSGVFDLYGGSISGNTAANGGGVRVEDSGQFNMHGGSITGNSAQSGSGGGVFNTGTFKMHGGVISGNNAAMRGGGIHNSTNGAIVTDGGEITGNSAADGGGVYHMGAGLTVSGNTVITGNTIKDTGAASNVYLGGDVYDSSNRLDQNSRFTIGVGGLAQTASIGVSGEMLSTSEGSTYKYMRNFAKAAEAGDYIDRFFCDDGENSIWANGDYLWFGTNPPHSHAAAPGGDAQTFEELKADEIWGPLTGGAYFLSADLSINPITIGSGQVTLCLNGHTLTTKDYSKPAITVEAGATLNLCDCQGGGKVMKKEAQEGQTSSKAAVKVSGTFNLYGGSITGNRNADTSAAWDPTRHHGGGLCVENGGQLHMHGGSITGNSTKNGSGGGVYVASGGTFALYDGEISGNTSGGTRTGDGGGGVYVASGGTASLLGGVISGNTTTGTGLGGGVYAGGSLTVGGSAVVQDNVKGTAPDTVASNIYLPKGKTVAVSAETPFDGAKLGITTQTAPTDSASVDIITGADGTGLKGCFSSDNEQFDFKESDSGLQLIPAGSGGGNDPSITPPDPEDRPTSFTVIFAYPGSDGQTETITLETDDNGTLTGKTLPTPTREGYKFDGWYLDDDTPVTTGTVFADSTAVTAKWTVCDHAHVRTTETKAATCLEMGETRYACSDCGAVWTVTTDLTEHQWGPWTKKDDNQHARVCASGKETHTEEHAWAEDTEQSVKPSCKGEGKTVYVCSGCKASKTVILPATAHSYPETWEHDENGHWQVCASCQAPSASQIHLFTEAVTTQPDCDTAGELTLTCSVCGYKTAEAIPALEHSFKSEWEKDPNGHWHVCARDNAHTSEKLAHSWDGGTVLTPATTTDMGTTQYTCTECGQTKTEQDIPMVEAVTYTLTYSPGENASGEAVTESGKTAGENVALPACAFTRTGYTFDGWKCGESAYRAGDSFTMLPSDVTFTAQWALSLPFTLEPGDTVVLEDGITISRSDGDGATVTVGKSQVDQDTLPEGAQPQEKTPETTITVPAGENVTLINDPVSMPGLDESGNETTIQSDRFAIEIPGGSTVQAGEGNPEITIPENETAKVALDGGVYDLPTGTTVTQGDSTVTVGTQGGSVSLGGDVTFGGGDGQVTVQTGEEDPVSVTVPKDGSVSVTPDENARRGGGKVTDSSGNVVGATVELRQGDTVYGSATTDSDGNYTFLGVYPGVYDLVVSEGGRTLTKRVEFTGEAPLDDAVLTDHASTLSIAEGTNLPVVVGGLDAEAETQQGSITMTVEQKPEAQAEGASSIRALAGEKAVLDCLDVEVQKGSSKLTETQEVLEIILPFEFSNVEGGVKVYRYHGGAEELTENETNAEGTFFTDPANSVIRIYSSKFSTYALGYAQPNTGLEISVAPGETKTAENGVTVESRAGENGDPVTITITNPADGDTTTVILHWEGDQTVLMNKETGEVTVPENARVPLTDLPGRKITLPEGGVVSPSGEITANPVNLDGATVTVTEPEGRTLTADKDGSITIPGGTTATVEDYDRTTTVTLPEGGEALVDRFGQMTVPENTVVKTGDDGAQITLPVGGTVDNDGNAASGKVQVGDITVTVIDPADGEVTVDPSGNVTIPAGATVIVTDDQGKETTVTVPNGGNTGSVKPDGSMTLPENSTVTIKDGEGHSTTITMPEDGGEVKPGESGGLLVPEGSKIQTGENCPEITVGPGNPATVKPDGSVTVPENGKVSIDNNGDGTTEITVPVAGGGTITPNDNGTVVVPENSTVTYRDRYGEETTTTVTGGVGTVKPDGTVTPGDGSLEDGERIELPDGSTITRAGGTITLTKDNVTTVVTLPSGTGKVTVYEPTGEITLPDASKVKTTVDTTEVPEVTVGGAGNTVKPGGEILLTRDENASVTVGGNPATTFTWSGEEWGAPSSVTPTSDGKLYAQDCIVQTGTGPKFLVSGELDPQDGGVKVLNQGRVTVVVDDSKKVEILNNDWESSAPIIVTPSQNGETILPERAIVRLDSGSNNTVKVPSGGTLSKDGETVKVEGGKSAIVEMTYGATATITAPAGGSFTVDENATVTVTGADAAIVYQTSKGELLGTYSAEANTTYYTVLFLEETLGYTCLAAQAVKSGEKAAKPNEPAENSTTLYYGDHYEFERWNNGGNSNADAYSFTDTVTGPVELYAKWNEVEHSSTAVQWEKNETHHWKICTQGGGCTERVEEAAHDTNGTGGACSVCGYKQGGGTPVDPDPETFTVTFNANGGSPVPATQTVESGKTAAEPAAPTKEGYTLDGWYTDTACTQKWSFTTAVTKSMTLFAKWEKKAPTLYTVTFDTDGGAPEPKAETVEAGRLVKKPDPSPTKTGCTFLGWVTTDGGSTYWKFATDTVTKTMTLYAKWETVSDAGTTVTPENPVTLPGNSGTVEKDGTSGSVTIKDGTGSTTTTIDPNGGDVTVDTTTGEVTVPGNSTVTIPGGSGDTTVKLPDGGKVGSDGSITLPDGGSAVTGTEDQPITITAPDGGGTVTPTDDGLEVPEGSTVKPGGSQTEITVPAGTKVDGDGTITVPAGESVTIPNGSGGSTTVTPSSGGGASTISPAEDGKVEIPAGSTVTTPDGTKVTVPDSGSSKVDGSGSITVPGNSEVTITDGAGNPAATITTPESGEGAITPTEDGKVEVPAGSTVKPGAGTGPEITVPTGSEVDGKGNVTVPGSGEVTITSGSGETTVTMPSTGGDVKPTVDGKAEIPGGSTVKPSDSSKPEITVGGQGGTVDPDTGEITITAGGSVTIEDEKGKKTTITIPDGGTVTPNNDGTVTVSGESTVKKPDGTTETIPAGGKVDPTDYKPAPTTGSGGTSTYAPTIEQPEHGQVTISPTNPKAGGKVTITVTPEEGYEPSAVTVTDSNGKPVEVTKNEDGTYTFIQPKGKVTISVTMGLGCPKDETCPLHAFTDTNITGWYHDGVHYCLVNGLMSGLGNGKFGPKNVLTRGMLAQILYNQAGRPEVTGQSPFEDVSENRYYAKAIAWAAENKIVAGYGNGRFGPNDPITRQQLAAILWRYAGSPESAGKLNSFTDGSKASNYAVPALQWAVEQKIVSGKGSGILDPRGKATRAEVAEMLMRYCLSVDKQQIESQGSHMKEKEVRASDRPDFLLAKDSAAREMLSSLAMARKYYNTRNSIVAPLFGISLYTTGAPEKIRIL